MKYSGNTVLLRRGRALRLRVGARSGRGYSQLQLHLVVKALRRDQHMEAKGFLSLVLLTNGHQPLGPLLSVYPHAHYLINEVLTDASPCVVRFFRWPHVPAHMKQWDCPQPSLPLGRSTLDRVRARRWRITVPGDAPAVASRAVARGTLGRRRLCDQVRVRCATLGFIILLRVGATLVRSTLSKTLVD
jgi:hypothetical protein